ncbi:MAG: nucleoside phosphorylase, partial [Clostridiales bacterium]
AVSVVSHGIGGPSMAIALEELVQCGCHTLIRVGTSGGMKETVLGGDLVVASAAVRAEGTSREYLPSPYPAVADFTVTQALYQAGLALSKARDGCRCHVGVVHSKDSFYGEVAPSTMPVGDRLIADWLAYVKCGCLTSEMECAALFAAGLSRGVRCGGVLNVLWNAELSRRGIENPRSHDTARGIQCALDG